MATAGRYVHGHHESVLRSHRWRTAENSAAYLLEHLTRGESLLDVGCGPGTITADLARRIAPGTVVGVHVSRSVVAFARTAAIEEQLSGVAFAASDACSLGFVDRAFDVVHAHQLLQHLSDPIAALREMRRVCSPEGVVAVRDCDYDATTWYPASSGLDRWLELYRATARANGGEPDAGRRLVSWAHAAGFSHVEASASAWCFATPADRVWWSATWAERVTSSDFAGHALDLGLTTRDELEALAAAWRAWAADDDAWFAVVHGEILARP
jgi:SAM-dependent methyltransferase